MPLLDLADAAVEKMIMGARKRGYLTHAQIGAVLVARQITAEQMDGIVAMLHPMGIITIEPEGVEHEAEEKSRGRE